MQSSVTIFRNNLYGCIVYPQNLPQVCTFLCYRSKPAKERDLSDMGSPYTVALYQKLENLFHFVSNYLYKVNFKIFKFMEIRMTKGVPFILQCNFTQCTLNAFYTSLCSFHKPQIIYCSHQNKLK